MKTKIWVGVEVYGLIVNDVHIFFSEPAAERWFEYYTGKSYEGETLSGTDYDETKIFELELDPAKLSRKVHYEFATLGGYSLIACQTHGDNLTTTNRDHVTCKRCLHMIALAKEISLPKPSLSADIRQVGDSGT